MSKHQKVVNKINKTKKSEKWKKYYEIFYINFICHKVSDGYFVFLSFVPRNKVYRNDVKFCEWYIDLKIYWNKKVYFWDEIEMNVSEKEWCVKCADRFECSCGTRWVWVFEAAFSIFIRYDKLKWESRLHFKWKLMIFF